MANEAVEVEVRGAAPLHVPLPFAMSAVGATVTLEEDGGGGGGKTLTLRLPYRPFDDVVTEARKAAPHALGALGLSNAGLMDLE